MRCLSNDTMTSFFLKVRSWQQNIEAAEYRTIIAAPDCRPRRLLPRYEFEDTFAAVTAAERTDATDLPCSGVLPARLQARAPGIRIAPACASTCALPAE